MPTLEIKDFPARHGRGGEPDPVDIHVGSRLHLRRKLTGLSQGQLAKALGLTFQQIQKYERGVNRMGASRLYRIARLLSVPVSYFFENMPIQDAPPMPGFAEDKQQALQDDDGLDRETLQRRETLQLVRAYYRIEERKQRRKIYELILSMSGEAFDKTSDQ